MGQVEVRVEGDHQCRAVCNRRQTQRGGQHKAVRLVSVCQVAEVGLCEHDHEGQGYEQQTDLALADLCVSLYKDTDQRLGAAVTTGHEHKVEIVEESSGVEVAICL